MVKIVTPMRRTLRHTPVVFVELLLRIRKGGKKGKGAGNGKADLWFGRKTCIHTSVRANQSATIDRPASADLWDADPLHAVSEIDDSWSRSACTSLVYRENDLAGASDRTKYDLLPSTTD
ncbi:hypothetical protein Trydic_g14335 [Trypoxylus dichotomus]